VGPETAAAWHFDRSAQAASGAEARGDRTPGGGRSPPRAQITATVVAFARKENLFLFALGYFKITALALIAEAGTYFLPRLNPQANLWEAVNGQRSPLDLVRFLKTMEGNLLEKQISIGTKELVDTRLIASRVPDKVVNERRRAAKRRQRKKGISPPKLIWNCWRGTSLSPMSRRPFGHLRQWSRHMQFAGKWRFFLKRGRVIVI
jgi:hypothetical protein